MGALLRRHRLAAGLSQEELAARAGLSARGISDLERGVRRAPRRDTLELLARALGLSARDRSLFGAGTRGFGGAGPRLVGRGRELALLDRHLAGEGPAMLVLAGEPGIGKTALLGEAMRRAGVVGWRVVHGGCGRPGSQGPYEPVLDALARHIRGARPADLPRDLRGCAWLVRLLPELAGAPLAPPAQALPPEHERRLIFGAVARFLANVVGPAGTLLVLDDLQWAGDDALDLLGALARQAGEWPLRVLAAYRDTEVTARHPVACALAGLAQGGLLARRTVGPLGGEEADILLAGLLPGSAPGDVGLRERIRSRSGGVPFVLVSWAHWARERVAESEDPSTLPWDVAQAIRQRALALPGAGPDVLGAAAIAGRGVSRTMLARVAGCTDAELIAALDACCRARLLEEDGERGYRFAHDLIREVLEADLGAARRATLHRRWAEALEATAGERELEALAYHYSRGDAAEKAAHYLERAGDLARGQSALAAAEAHYRQSLECLDGLGRPLALAVVREKLGAVLDVRGRYDEALAAFEDAAAFQAAADPERLCEVAARIGRVHARRGTPKEGLARLRPLLADLEASPASDGAAALQVALAHLYFKTGRYVEQLAAARRGASLARAAGNAWLLADAECRRGTAYLMLERVEEGIAVLEEVTRLAEDAGDLDSLVRALNNLGEVQLDRGDCAAAGAYNDRALMVAERMQDPVFIANQTYRRAEIAVYAGEWGSARGDFAQAEALSRRIGSGWILSYALAGGGRLALLEGDAEGARRRLEAVLAMAEGSGDLQVLRYAAGMLAQCDLLRGEAAAARARLEPLLDHPGLEESGVAAHILPPLARAYLALDEVAHADQVLSRLLARARRTQSNLGLIEALWIRATADARLGAGERAEDALAEGLALARRMPYPHAEGRYLCVYGALCAGRGDGAAARPHLEQARAIFARLGAPHEVERVRGALAALRSVGRARR